MNNQQSITSNLNPYPTKIVCAGLIGGAIEFYDFTLYGILATFFAPYFFPAESKFISILGAYSVFAIGFFARPLGAIIFGYVGDQYGRKVALFWSLMLMAIATLSIGLLPTYKQIGIMAPILMTLIRVIQGLSAGGEYSGALILAIEHGSKIRSGLIGSSITSGCMSGLVLGSIAGVICSLPGMPIWVWRVPFLIGFCISLIGLYVRFSLSESPIFLRESKKISSYSIMNEIRNNFGNIIAVIFLSGFNGIAIYVYFVFMSGYIADVTDVTINIAKLYTCVGTIVLMFMLITFGSLSDYVNRIHMVLLGAVLTVSSALIMFYRMPYLSNNMIFVYQMCFVISLGVFSGPLNTFIVEIFHTKIRYRFAAIGYSLGTGFIGGSAPLIASLLSLSKSNKLLLSGYMLIAGTLAISSLLWMNNKMFTKKTSCLKNLVKASF